ncbi:MAG: 23S rRNA (uracil(1939)-C(5))-methyltransferase RlmD [Schwartzia sp.]|nr:23S rRNA (uracil(1939)-C(5))-methyltransferase RlmD [Schwartzia sp. (in: firmicutes)]
MAKEIPVKAGALVELSVERLGVHAEGIARAHGFTVFVTGALPGERVRARVGIVKKTYASAALTEILEASPERREPRCPVYAACGGCQLQHLSYEAQLREKRRQVEDAVRHIGGLDGVEICPTIGGEPWGYRNKMQFPVGRVGGKAVIGCFAQGSHTIVDTQLCHIQHRMNNELMNAMREAVRELRIPVYDEDRHAGLVRHIVGRVGVNGDAMAVVVTARRELPQAKELVKFLRARVPRLVSVHQNVQTYRNNVILGRETKLLWGKPTIHDIIGPLTFQVSPRSFFQVNTAQAETLYKKALEFANLGGGETVIDAYCGTGTITLFLARKARKTYGIEVVPPAILDARKNARANHIRNAEFIVGDAADVMPRLYREGVRPDVVVTDPPKAGCTSVVLETFARMNPSRIVYVSCNPATLARDLAILDGLGYHTEKIQPVDMFPMTSHIETVSLIVPKILDFR